MTLFFYETELRFKSFAFKISFKFFVEFYSSCISPSIPFDLCLFWKRICVLTQQIQVSLILQRQAAALQLSKSIIFFSKNSLDFLLLKCRYLSNSMSMCFLFIVVTMWDLCKYDVTLCTKAQSIFILIHVAIL